MAAPQFDRGPDRGWILDINERAAKRHVAHGNLAHAATRVERRGKKKFGAFRVPFVAHGFGILCKRFHSIEWRCQTHQSSKAAARSRYFPGARSNSQSAPPELRRPQYRGNVPQVTVIVKNPSGYQFSVVGKVCSSGTFTPGRYVNALEALSIAGDPTEFAQLGSVNIIRNSGGQMHKFPVGCKRHSAAVHHLSASRTFPQYLVVTPSLLPSRRPPRQRLVSRKIDPQPGCTDPQPYRS